MLVFIRRPGESFVLMPKRGIRSSEVTLAKLFGSGPIVITNLRSESNPIEVEIKVPDNLMYVESDHCTQWCLYPKETVNLRQVTLDQLFASGPITFMVTRVALKSVKLGVTAPSELSIKRGEVFEKELRDEQRSAIFG